MNLTKETKEYIVGLFQEHYINMDYCHHNLKPFLKEKGLLQPELEVGKWYWFSIGESLYLAPFKEMCAGDYRAEYYFYIDSFMSGSGCFNGVARGATDEEVREALINEAKKRGFKDGCSVIPVNDSRVFRKCGNPPICITRQ